MAHNHHQHALDGQPEREYELAWERWIARQPNKADARFAAGIEEWTSPGALPPE